MLDAIVDISHHNGTGLDFNAAAGAGILGVIQKVSQGNSFRDPTMSANRAAIGAAGLLFGGYHFGDGSDGGAQANFFLSVLAPQSGDLMVLDLESNTAGPSMTLEEARTFVTAINVATGKWPVLYAGHYLKQMLPPGGDATLSKCPLWIAQYGPAPVLPSGWATWSLWQYTDGAVPSPTTAPGLGHCDRDRFNGDPTSLAAFWQNASPN